jgi:hypothetical protein
MGLSKFVYTHQWLLNHLSFVDEFGMEEGSGYSKQPTDGLFGFVGGHAACSSSLMSCEVREGMWQVVGGEFDGRKVIVIIGINVNSPLTVCQSLHQLLFPFHDTSTLLICTSHTV